MIKWVLHDLLTQQYTVGYISGRVVTYRRGLSVPNTVNDFIATYAYSAFTGKNVIVYEA